MTIGGKDDMGGLRKSGNARAVTAENTATVDDGEQRVVRLDAAAQALIGSQLKAMYAEICSEPVPGELLALLAELERKDTGK